MSSYRVKLSANPASRDCKIINKSNNLDVRDTEDAVLFSIRI